MKRVLLLLTACALLAGCDPYKSARDVIAADYGYIVTARDQNVQTCQATPTLGKCITINKAIDLHKTAQDTLNASCSGTPLEGNQPYADGGPCAPIKSLETGLKSAVDNLQEIMGDIKAVIR